MTLFEIDECLILGLTISTKIAFNPYQRREGIEGQDPLEKKKYIYVI